MNILIQTCLYNEETSINLFLQYYNSLINDIGSGTIIFIDFGCTDYTIKRIKQFRFHPTVKIEIINNYTTEHREDILMLYRNHYWKRLKNNFDYVFIVDVDEIVHDDDLINNLTSGVDCLLSEGVDVVTNHFKVISKRVKKCEDIKLFYRNVKFFKNLNKINVFNPKTFHPNFYDGCHLAKPICKLPFNIKPTYLLHFKHIGYKLFIKIAKEKSNRSLTHSNTFNHGYHYTLNKDYTERKYNDESNSNLIDITGRPPNLVPEFTPTFYSVIENYKNMFT